MTKLQNVPGQRVGYVRISSPDQNNDRQLEGVELDRIFTEVASGKDRHRPALAALLDFVREGDVVVVHSMDRLARNLDDLRLLVRTLTDQRITIEFVNEKLTFTDNSSPMGTLLLSVMGAFAEFERSLIHERQREGIEIAKRRGVYKGRKPVLTRPQALQMRERISHGEAKTKMAQELGISRATVYQYLKQIDGGC
jgi:DNA invertase Pin-like site-specific DNA recombinase